MQGMKLFKDIKDCLRFFFCLKEYNTARKVDARSLIQAQKSQRETPLETKFLTGSSGAGDKLVDILAYSILPDHFHIILKQAKDNGIPLFMKKLGTGFAMRHNKTHNLNGHLFESTYKANLIATEDELLFLSAYMHLEPSCKKDKAIDSIKATEETLQKISQYPWSSLGEYLNTPPYFIDLIEIKRVKPNIDTQPLVSALGTQSYENYILNFWGKENCCKIDKKFL